MKKKQIQDFERLAEEIGEAGKQQDAQLSDMRKAFAEGAKGFADAIGSVVAMVKGGKPPPQVAQETAPADGDHDDDVRDDEDGEGRDTPPPAPARRARPPADPDAGHTDMQMGDDGDEFLDAGQLVKDTLAELRAARAERARSAANNERMEKAIAETHRLLHGVLAAQVQTTSPLFKGLAAIGEQMSNIPGPSVLGGARPHANEVGRFGGAVVFEGRLATLDPVVRQQTLIKGMQKRVLSEAHVAQYQTTGKFSTDPAVHAATLKAVEALLPA